jgi:hypothetical protein
MKGKEGGGRLSLQGVLLVLELGGRIVGRGLREVVRFPGKEVLLLESIL